VPCDWRRPTLERVRQRIWHPEDPRVFTPKTFGWGWTVNVGRLWWLLRARIDGRPPSGPADRRRG
jgi:hypothetical protein